MKIAIPLLNDCVSPVLDTAERLLVINVDKSAVSSREEISLIGLGLTKTADIIAKHANILICGALSRTMSTYLESRGVNVYPWTMGNIDRIIEIVISGNTPGPEFTMPGCNRNRNGKCMQGLQFRKGRLNKDLNNINRVSRGKGRKQ
ncbi:NifB/NifX family molybdenum-iron cluster-binding protein [Candidatus Latescibacterota bacterium]